MFLFKICLFKNLEITNVLIIVKLNYIFGIIFIVHIHFTYEKIVVAYTTFHIMTTFFIIYI